MSKEKSRTDIPSPTPDEPASETIGERRKRLAHLVGRLLAQTWLKRQRVSDNVDQPQVDRP